MARRDVVGPFDRSFPWASVTKPATALAVLVAVEEGTLALDEPAGPAGSTVRHLLAHASGLGPEPGPPLAAPGTRRIYSNAGYARAGALVAERVGHAVRRLPGRGCPRAAGHGRARCWTRWPRAVGRPPDWPARWPTCSRSVRSGPRPTLVSAETTWREAISVQFPGLAGVLPGFGPFDPCDWGLGVEIRGAKQPHWTGTANSPATFGHFGQSGSFLWVDPVAGVLCAGLADRPFGVWASGRGRPWPTRCWPSVGGPAAGS